MKKKITRIWGVGLIVALLSSLLVMGAPAAAVDNLWDAEITPGAPTYALAALDANVADMAVYNDGEEIWVVTGTDNYTYKSVDGGRSWVKGNTDALALASPDLIAVAPDDSSVIAVCDKSEMALYVTNNGGAVWNSLGTVADTTAGTEIATITDIDISATRSGVNMVVVAGQDDTTQGNAYYFEVGSAAPVWTQMKSKAGFNWNQIIDTGGTANSTSEYVYAVAFSPNYPSDQVMVAVTGNVTGAAAFDNITFEIFSFSHKKWNNSAGFGTGYPAVLETAPTTTITSVTYASIALDPEYLGSDDILRNSFTGLTVVGGDTDNGGIYRLKDVVLKNIDEGQDIYSVAYDGTNLVAGTTGTTVRYTEDPMASVPTVNPTSSLKSPGGASNTIVAWAGTDVLAATSGDESALSLSRSNGAAFNDISMISTNITSSQDVAVSADGSTIYWVTDDGAVTTNATQNDLSVWRKTTDWERILSVKIDNASTAFLPYIVRAAPDDPDVIYVGQVGGTAIYYSKDGGEDKWYQRTCGVALQDLAVESSDVAYAISEGGSVVTTTNAGFTWGPPQTCNFVAGNGYSLYSAMEDVVLAGSTGGYVSYSTDGGTSFSKITKPVDTDATNVVLIADADYADNNIIYAATNAANKNVKRWEVGTSTAWTDMVYDTLGSSMGIYGLAQQGGVLYALGENTTQSYLFQCLDPTIADYTSPVFWDSTATTADTDSNDTEVTLGSGAASHNALASSTGSNKLWACKTNLHNKLYGYLDVLAVEGPTLLSPSTGFNDPVNTVTGYANEIAFSWERLSNATEYELFIAYDDAFKESVTLVAVSSSKSTVVQAVGPDKTDDAKVNFMPGATYYWRVHASAPLTSPFSEVRSFTIQPGVAMVPSIGSPANGTTITTTTPAFSWSPVAGATKYEFQLAVSTNFGASIFKTELADTGIRPAVKLDQGMTYFWRVRAIAPVTGDWSTIANFVVAEEEAPPAPAAPPVVVEQVPAPIIQIPPAPPAQEIVIPPAPAPPAPIAPGYIWAIIIIGAVLVIAVVVLIVRTRRSV
jgi:hypothetical protein